MRKLVTLCFIRKQDMTQIYRVSFQDPILNGMGTIIKSEAMCLSSAFQPSIVSSKKIYIRGIDLTQSKLDVTNYYTVNSLSKRIESLDGQQIIPKIIWSV